MAVLAVRRTQVENCKCDLCGYKWQSRKYDRTGKLPKACPLCKQYTWNEGGKKK